jgi:hypothetical protein
MVVALTVFVLATSPVAPVGAQTQQRPQTQQKELLDDFWERSNMQDAGPGAGVLRLDIDLDGDGQNEILLANQENRDRHGGAVKWEVYQQVDGPRYRRIGALIFSLELFRILEKQTRSEAFRFGECHDKNAAGEIERCGDLVTYRVDDKGITELERKPLQEPEIKATIERMDTWRTTAKVRMLYAGVDDRGLFENPTWYEDGKPASGVMNLEGLVLVK